MPYQNPELEEKIEQHHRRSTVELSDQNLIDKDMQIVVKHAIIRKKCKELRLTSNEITCDGAWILSEALNNNKTLKDLSLWNNRICDTGVIYLAQILLINNNTLRILNLGKNKITDVGAGELAEMLRKNQTIIELYLGENEISDDGVRMLAKSIEKYNTTLEILSLTSNQFVTNQCVSHLHKMIMHNNTLKQLWLDNCNLSRSNKQKLQMTQRTKINFSVYAR
jgi:Ran GTPase-activating protein (RanGAP) involved in mRNA processing and transport